MEFTHHQTNELASIRSEIKRLKNRERTLCSAFPTRRPNHSSHQHDATIERQLRQVFRQSRFSDVVGF